MLQTGKNTEQKSDAQTWKMLKKTAQARFPRPELGARTKQWSNIGVCLGQIEAWALTLTSWSLVMPSIFSSLSTCRPPLPSKSIIHRLTMAYTKLELHLSSGPRQPLNMVFACATSQGVVTLLKSLHTLAIAMSLLAVPFISIRSRHLRYHFFVHMHVLDRPLIRLLSASDFSFSAS